MFLDRLVIHSIKLFNDFDRTDFTSTIYHLGSNEEKAFIELFAVLIGLEENWGKLLLFFIEDTSPPPLDDFYL